MLFEASQIISVTVLGLKIGTCLPVINNPIWIQLWQVEYPKGGSTYQP